MSRKALAYAMHACCTLHPCVFVLSLRKHCRPTRISNNRRSEAIQDHIYSTVTFTGAAPWSYDDHMRVSSQWHDEALSLGIHTIFEGISSSIFIWFDGDSGQRSLLHRLEMNAKTVRDADADSKVSVGPNQNMSAATLYHQRMGSRVGQS